MVGPTRDVLLSVICPHLVSCSVSEHENIRLVCLTGLGEHPPGVFHDLEGQA